MPLKIYLLGQFKLQAGDQVIELPSRPAQSLLAYLALHAGVAHRREKLAGLLWPEASEANARGYLRQALWRIRKALESGGLNWEDYLQVSDISLSFNAAAEYWLDTELLLASAQRSTAVEARLLDGLIETAELYRGELLPGFYDEWGLPERDRLQSAYHQVMSLLLERLAQVGRWSEVLVWGEQWIQLGSSPEAAFRALMRAHAGLGDQAMLHAAYQRCVEALRRDLDLEPSLETQQLYEQLRRGELASPASKPAEHAPQLPSFLDEIAPLLLEKPLFVARQHQLAQLQGYLSQALNGHGLVAFITGEAGSGKTALLHEFTRRALAAHPQLIAASGSCNAYTGVGDPFSPFREILSLLSGDVETRLAAGAMTREHALRLWHLLPLTAQALVENGPGLLDTFIPGAALRQRAAASASNPAAWLPRLDAILDSQPDSPQLSTPQQKDLFEQYTRLLQALARSAPLLLLVDDLQWADLGSISLLFHLGRRLAGSRILLLGAYRSEEIAIGRDGKRHPLDSTLNELRRDYGDITVDLLRDESRGFMEALLDSEPNRLGITFRDMLYRQTQGHPLFTVELLRGLQERGDLVQDPQGCWIEGQALDWESLPARVDAVVAERIDRLDQPLRDALRVACVEGEDFTAEVVARVQAADPRPLLERLSTELDRKHRLIYAHSIQRTAGQFLSRYRFRHILFQRYLYRSLDEVERVHLHEQVGTALETLYGTQEHPEAFAVQLALHFQKAHNTPKAIRYLHQAGERARLLSAYQEAITHLDTALSLLVPLPPSPERDEQELALQLSLGMAWVGIQGYGQVMKNAFVRARQLCQQMGKTYQLCQVVGGLAIFHYVRAEYEQARELAEEALSLAQQIEDPLLTTLTHWYLGFILFCLGELNPALDHLKQVIAFYQPERHHRALLRLQGSDPGPSAMAYIASCLWCLGYPEQAVQHSQQALDLAHKLAHPFTLADVVCYGGCLLSEMCRDPAGLSSHSQELRQLADEKTPGWAGSADIHLGEALIMSESFEDGIAQIHKGVLYGVVSDERCNRSGSYCYLSEAQAKLGRVSEGLATLDEALDMVADTGERYYEAELHRLRGELLLLHGDQAAAKASFEQAIQIARRQQAKSWELRAATSLARLLHAQGRRAAARQALAEVYGWFTEGFDTPDLQEARALLEALA